MSGYGYPQPGSNNPPGYPYGAPPPPTPAYGQPPHSSTPPGPPQPYAPNPNPGSGPGQPYAPNPNPGSGPGPAHQHYSSSSPSYGKPDKPPKQDSYGGHGYPTPGGHTGYPTAHPPSSYGGGQHQQYPGPPSGGGTPFASLLPSTFPPGTDPNVVACFQVADVDGSGMIEDKELQRALSSYNQSFSLRTVHLLMFTFTGSTARKIGPKEFTSLFYSLQSWREIFERHDRDRSGKIDASELRDALYGLGFAVSPPVLETLVSKFDKTGGMSKAIEYDNFIECCLTVKGLTEKFKEKDKSYMGTATFTYEEFMLTVLPFLIA